MRGVPEDVVERLERLAARERVSVNTLAVRELAESSRRADNADLLDALPDLGVDPSTLVNEIKAGRAAR